MSAEILTQAALWIAQHDVRSSMNNIALQSSYETKDCTCFGQGARSYALGLPRTSFSAAGYPTSDAVDKAFFDLAGQSELPITIGKERAEGAVAYVGKILDAKYSSNFSVSEVRAFDTSGELSSRSFGRGRILTIAAGASATANGAGLQLRGISVTRKAFAALHVTAAGGATPTLDVIIQSDDNAGFTTPTTRATFSQLAVVGSQMVEIDGAITDDYWRARYTIGGSTPSFDFAVSLGFEEQV